MVEYSPTTYPDSGVNYDLMDPFKIACQEAALSTGKNIDRFRKENLSVKEIAESRGESAYQVELSLVSGIISDGPFPIRIAHVEEGLGTKNEVAMQTRALQEKLNLAEDIRDMLGRSFYRGVAIDNAAMILNDLSTAGVSPISFLLHVAAYPSSWFADEERNHDLIQGTLDACNLARCSWGGGESPALRDIINEGHAVLSGSAWGIGFSWNRLNPMYLEEGDRIVLVGIDGPGANGITLLRTTIKDRLAKGYETLLSDGRTYGEAILAPTPIYARLVDALSDQKVRVNYAVNITGHAWRKIMRSSREFSYYIDKVPEAPEVFKLIQEVSGMSNEQIYGDYNMGAGFALFTRPDMAGQAVRIAKDLGYKAFDAGVVEKGPRRVVIGPPVNVTFSGEALQIR